MSECRAWEACQMQPTWGLRDWIPVFWMLVIAMVYFRDAIGRLHSSVIQTKILPFSFIGMKGTGRGENRDNIMVRVSSPLCFIWAFIVHLCLSKAEWFSITLGKPQGLPISIFSSCNLYPPPCLIQTFNSIHAALPINKQASKWKNSFWLLELLLTLQLKDYDISRVGSYDRLAHIGIEALICHLVFLDSVSLSVKRE